MKTSICFICLFISLNSWAQKKDTVPGLFAPKVVFQECLDKHIPPDFYKGKFLILDFWATWCAPCIAGFPHFNQLADKYSSADVLFASYTVEPENIQAKFFARTKKELHAYKLSDTTKKTRDAFEIWAYPTCVIIGPDNTIRWKGGTESLTADILDRVILKHEQLYSPNPVKQNIVVDIKRPAKNVTGVGVFNITKADPNNKNFNQGTYRSDKMGISDYHKPNVHLDSFLQDLTGFSPSTRILSNDTLRLKKTYNIDFRTRTDTAYYKDYDNTIFPASSRKNFILTTIGDSLKFKASLVKQPVKHYELSITDTAKLHAFMSMQKGHSSFDDDHLPAFEITNYTLKGISENLENDAKIIITTDNIHDDNGYDFSLNLTSIASLKEQLKAYGLELKEVTSDVEFLNINFTDMVTRP